MNVVATHPESELALYFSEAASWDQDRQRLLQRSQRVAWRVAAAGWVCAVCAAAALACLSPLKRVEPFVIRVDNSTGAVDVVPVYAGQADMGEAVTRYFLTHYVFVCERFNFSTAESDYEECSAFHGAQRNQAWFALWNPHSPNSPLNLHKDGSSVTAQVQSVSFFKRGNGMVDLAQVRYLKLERPGVGAAAHVTHWIATVQYVYGAAATDPKIRRWNPLGFKIIDFVTEPEVVRDEASGAQTGAQGSP